MTMTKRRPWPGKKTVGQDLFDGLEYNYTV
jgi:hypothetical protein